MSDQCITKSGAKCLGVNCNKFKLMVLTNITSIDFSQVLFIFLKKPLGPSAC